MRDHRGVFITGTDTGIGKTLVGVSLVRALAAEGRRVAVMKPVASGAEPVAGGLRNEDALALAEASNVPAPYQTINPYCFIAPISPHIAAKEAKITVDLSVIRRHFEALVSLSERIVVEGAGGWYAPLSDTHTMADLAETLGLPVLMVVGLRLGCLNHALLTKQAIESRGASFAGWIANTIDPAFERQAENLATLERTLGQTPVAVIPFQPDAATALRHGLCAAQGLALL